MSHRREDMGFIEMLRQTNKRLAALENGGSRAKRNDIRLGDLVVGTDPQTGKVKVSSHRTGDSTLLGKDEDAKWSYAGELEYTDYNDSPPHVMSTTLTAVEVVISLAVPVTADILIDVNFKAVENSGTAAGSIIIHGSLPAGKNVWVTPCNVPCPRNSIIYSTLLEYLGTDLPRDLSIFVRFGSPQATKPSYGGSQHYGEYTDPGTEGGGSSGGTPEPPPDPGTTNPDPDTTGGGGGVPPSGGTGNITGDLVPPNGKCWFGASAPPVNGSGTDAVGVAQLQAVMGKRCDSYHFYYKGASWTGYPTARELAILETPQHRAIGFYNWKPDPTKSMRQIADGGADANIDRVSEGLNRYPHSMWVAIQHEYDNDNANHPSSQQKTDYREMFQHVVDRFGTNGVTNVSYVWNVTGFGKWGIDYNELYPGDDWVDWIAFDPYAFRPDTTLNDIMNATSGGGASWPGFYNWATTPRTGFTGLKPIMTGEWGYSMGPAFASATPAAGTDAQAAAFFAQVGPNMGSFPQVKAMMYWNSLTERGNYQITNPQVGSGPKTAFANMANHSVFALSTADYE